MHVIDGLGRQSCGGCNKSHVFIFIFNPDIWILDLATFRTSKQWNHVSCLNGLSVNYWSYRLWVLTRQQAEVPGVYENTTVFSNSVPLYRAQSPSGLQTTDILFFTFLNHIPATTVLVIVSSAAPQKIVLIFGVMLPPPPPPPPRRTKIALVWTRFSGYPVFHS